MGLGTRAHPWAVDWQRRVSGGGCNEFVRGLTKRTVRTKGNRLETDVEALLLDDGIGSPVLGSGVRVGTGGTHLTFPENGVAAPGLFSKVP